MIDYHYQYHYQYQIKWRVAVIIVSSTGGFISKRPGREYLSIMISKFNVTQLNSVQLKLTCCQILPGQPSDQTVHPPCRSDIRDANGRLSEVIRNRSDLQPITHQQSTTITNSLDPHERHSINIIGISVGRWRGSLVCGGVGTLHIVIPSKLYGTLAK